MSRRDAGFSAAARSPASAAAAGRVPAVRACEAQRRSRRPVRRRNHGRDGTIVRLDNDCRSASQCITPPRQACGQPARKRDTHRAHRATKSNSCFVGRRVTQGRQPDAESLWFRSCALPSGARPASAAAPAPDSDQQECAPFVDCPDCRERKPDECERRQRVLTSETEGVRDRNEHHMRQGRRQGGRVRACIGQRELADWADKRSHRLRQVDDRAALRDRAFWPSRSLRARPVEIPSSTDMVLL